MPPLVLLAVASPLAAAPVELSAADRVPAVIVVLTPFGAGSAGGTSRFTDAMADVLQQRTDLRPLSAEQAGIDLAALKRCPIRQQLTCWSQVVRATRENGRAPVQLLFGLSVRRVDDATDRLTITMLDATLVDRLRGPITRDEIEQAIFTRSPRTPPVNTSIRDGPSVRDTIDALVTGHLAEALARLGRWSPFGAATLNSSCDGCEVILDDRLVGIARFGRLRIMGVRAGEHRLQLRRNGVTMVRCRFSVVPPHSTVVRPSACVAVGTETPIERLVLRYGGLATGIAGAALVTVGIVQASTGPRAICVTPAEANGDGCAELGAPTLGFDSDPSLTDRRDRVNPSGVPTVALGAGLLGMGATLAAGSWLWDDWPWWGELLLGAAVGGAVVGIGTAVGGGS